MARRAGAGARRPRPHSGAVQGTETAGLSTCDAMCVMRSLGSRFPISRFAREDASDELHGEIGHGPTSSEFITRWRRKLPMPYVSMLIKRVLVLGGFCGIVSATRGDYAVATLSQKVQELDYIIAHLPEDLDARFAGVDVKLASIREVQSLHTKRFTVIEQRLDGVESRLDRVEGRLDAVEGRLDRVEGRLDRIENKMDLVESRLDRVESRLDRVESKLDAIDLRLGSIEGLLKQLVAKS